MTVVSRENIETWEADSPKLYQFRRGIEEMQKISDKSLMDERGYQWCAGVHGGFGGQPYCEHNTLNFVTWHRPYLLDFEIKIRDRIRVFAGQQAAEEWRIPYWNWASRFVEGMPKAFTDETYVDNGETKPNPLYSMPYQLPYWPGNPVGNPGGWPTETYRTPGDLATLQSLRDGVLAALDKKQFAGITGFSRTIEQPHNGLHVWVNGYMVTLRSSFDPIFWCHHATVDRQWWIWQQENGDSTVPEEQRNFTCRPFKFQDNRAEAFFDTEKLGYDYAGTTSSVAHSVATADADSDSDSEEPETSSLLVDLGSLGREPDRAYLHVLGLRHTEDTLEVRVYIDRKSATVDTPQTPRSGYVGKLTILGHGECPGAEGHCDHRIEPRFSGDVRAPHHLAPFDTYIDLTSSLKRLARKRKRAKKRDGIGKVRICAVVVDTEGKQRPISSIHFDHLRLASD